MLPATRLKASSAAILTRSKMLKSGNQAVPSTTPVLVTSWTSDTTYPATIASDGIRVSGSGACTITGKYQNADYNGVGTIHIYRNGVSIKSTPMSSGANNVTLTWAGTLNEGDLIQMYAQSSFTYNSLNVQGATTFVEIVPT